mmetsp:Transcript_35289/g.101481  ORF Transcript_35289/g.101481 Transcript_35289/m.101481 type:complete len:275 (-) Transcript_35289:24-848(-)
MTSLRELNSNDPWNHNLRSRYGSKGRLSMTMVLGDPCCANVFVPVTLSPPFRRAGSEPRLGTMQRRVVGKAEVATLAPTPSAGSSRPSTDGGNQRGPQYVSLGKRLIKVPSEFGDGDPNGTLTWYSESGLHSHMSPLSVQQSSYVNHSSKFDMIKPPKTFRDFELQEATKRTKTSLPFTATSTQRATYPDFSNHKDLCYRKPPSVKKQPPPMGKQERKAMVTSGDMQGFSAAEMAACRGTPTFTPDHKCAEAAAAEDIRSRPATIGRNLHYFQE